MGAERRAVSEECKKRVKQVFLELVSEELGREATEDDLPWDFDKIFEFYEAMEFKRCEEVPKVKRALEVLRGVNYDAYEEVRKRCWVIDERYALESVASHMPFPMEGKIISNVYIGGAYLEYMTEEGIAECLLHEGLHIDFERNPTKYGVKDRDTYRMFKFFGLHEDKIDKAIEKTALAGYRGESSLAMSKVWAKRKKRLWIEEPILRIHTCMTGIEEERFYGLEEKGANPSISLGAWFVPVVLICVFVALPLGWWALTSTFPPAEKRGLV